MNSGSGMAGAAVAPSEEPPERDPAENDDVLVAVPGNQQAGSFLRLPWRFWPPSLSGQKHAAVDQGLGGQPLDLDSDLYLSLTEDLQEQSRTHPHVWEYLTELPMDEIGMPQYHSRLTKGMGGQEYRNIIYPVSEGIFIHLYPDPRDSRDFYIAIEPSMGPNVPGLMDQVDRKLISYIEELKADDGDDRSKVLLSCLERICTVNGGMRNRKAIRVTKAELEGLRYLMVRDKEGLGAMEPLILDPYIEDISCSGVGPLFVEHKIFGGLKAGISFDTESELDRFVIKLSEKIGRPVTVRDPIVDAVLPDGSRVNIVFGGDVSKRGSNFTVRKFKTTPMSIIDLIDGGTLSYEMAAYLSLMIGTGMNGFVSGETASGKTTLLNAATTLIPPNHKIVSIEDTAELQVPHPNWTREVVRGSAGGSSSVTMFDLLKAAMRQRPNEIIIGEIRGEEGAIAFQAMQTGHACLATFHASSVEKLIQRLTGHPINIPKTYVDSLNLVIIMSAVRLPDGSTGRRVMSINEIVSYDTETNSFNYIEVFRWNPATDKFEFPGFNNAYLLENVVGIRRGLPPKETRRIYDEITARAVVLRKLHERGISNFYELHGILSQAYRQGLFR
ncbi:MAG: type II/IV secretion system ATPase subunit [Chloroflexi bacterium]|nr:type II/IV secretion system ATPase subunit [Chloroflexota bacterium]